MEGKLREDQLGELKIGIAGLVFPRAGVLKERAAVGVDGRSCQAERLHGGRCWAARLCSWCSGSRLSWKLSRWGGSGGRGAGSSCTSDARVLTDPDGSISRYLTSGWECWDRYWQSFLARRHIWNICWR